MKGHNYETNFKACFLFLSKKDAETFVRTIYAGNAIMTLKSKDSVKIITVRTTSFEPDETTGGSAATETANAPDAIPNVSKFIGQELSKSDRPELGIFLNKISVATIFGHKMRYVSRKKKKNSKFQWSLMLESVLN